MFDLGTIYRPITAAPFRSNETYREISPCEVLKPFVRCFWGTPMPVMPETAKLYTQENSLVVPDTCMDIIYHIDYSANRINGGFCALDEQAHQAGMQAYTGRTAIFAIRFNVWAVGLFTRDSLAGTKNKCFAVEEFFPHLSREIEARLFYLPSLEEKARFAEGLLMQHLDTARIDNDFMNSVYYMINTCGREKISSAAAFAGVSEKRLERVFSRNTGISPKGLSGLIRYQLLWQELAGGGCMNVMDAVEKYGYFDQAHLINDFRKHHLMTPSQAVRLAGQNR